MSISEVLFITEVITSTVNESISDTVDHFWSINDVEIELWKELISAGLMAVELTSGGEVFQILVISKHSYRIRDIINFKTLLFKNFDNNQ